MLPKVDGVRSLRQSMVSIGEVPNSTRNDKRVKIYVTPPEAPSDDVREKKTLINRLSLPSGSLNQFQGQQGAISSRNFDSRKNDSQTFSVSNSDFSKSSQFKAALPNKLKIPLFKSISSQLHHILSNKTSIFPDKLFGSVHTQKETDNLQTNTIFRSVDKSAKIRNIPAPLSLSKDKDFLSENSFTNFNGISGIKESKEGRHRAKDNITGDSLRRRITKDKLTSEQY